MKQVDERWKKIQQTTFTNWVKEVLRKRSTKNAKLVIQDLQSDFQDGLALVNLLEVLAEKERIGRYNANPKLKPQKLENLGVSFRFMGDEKIKLVNIGPEDLFNGELKLILGLVWTLIRHYQMKSTGKSVSTKNALLEWIRTQIPELNIKNFTGDWNDGIALCTLIDRIVPGACSHYSTLDSKDGLQNCKLGIQLSNDKLNIPILIDPTDFNSKAVDELSVMTYLSYFYRLWTNKLLRWIQSQIPYRNVENLGIDWCNGVNLVALCNAISPGLLAEWSSLDPHKGVENLSLGMKAAQDSLGIQPLFKPEQMANPITDEMGNSIYLARFMNAKAAASPKQVTAKGQGLTRAFVGKVAEFDVDTSRGGTGSLDVTITIEGTNLEVDVINPKKDSYKVSYTPNKTGALQIEVKWGGSSISGSPFKCTVTDLSGLSVSSRYVTGLQAAVVGKPVPMEINGVRTSQDLTVTIKHPGGASEMAKMSVTGSKIEASYIPTRVGEDTVVVKYANSDVPGSPFNVVVVDPKQCSVVYEDPPPGQPAIIGKKTTFLITASNENIKGIVAESKSPNSGVRELSYTLKKNNTYIGTYVPTDVGDHYVIVTCGGDPVRGSPMALPVADPFKCTFTGGIPKYMVIGKSKDIAVSTTSAGASKLEASSGTPNVISAAASKAGPDKYFVKLQAKVIGESSITMHWAKEVVAKTPFTVNVCDPSKVTVSGSALSEGKAKISETIELIVNAEKAGKADLDVRPTSPSGNICVTEVVDNGKGKHTVTFKAYEIGNHTIAVTWGDEPIPKSPFKMEFCKAVDIATFTATGNGLTTTIATHISTFEVITTESGLLDDDTLSIQIEGEGLKCNQVQASKLTGESKEIQFSTADIGKGKYTISYTVPREGKYKLYIYCEGENIKESPFTITALPPAEASKCRAFGKSLEPGAFFNVGTPLEFNVDCTKAGTGEVEVTATNPKSSEMQVYTADQSTQREVIHAIKVDPKMIGVHTVQIAWSKVGIPDSPFTFDVADPKAVKLIRFPNAEGFLAKVGQAIAFEVNTAMAGNGTLDCKAVVNKINTEDFTMTKKGDGIFEAQFIPKEIGSLQILLLYNGESLLPVPWTCESVDPSNFTVNPPTQFGRQKEYVKFTITGITPETKNVKAKCTHPKHDATVKVEFANEVATTRFTPKQIGDYDCEVTCGGQHVSGSPFVVKICNPDNCKLSGQPPNAMHLNEEETMTFKTDGAGPGEISCSVAATVGDKPIEYSVKSSANMEQLTLQPKEIGTCQITVTWAGYTVPNAPFEVNIIDASAVKVDCPALQQKVFSGQEMQFFIDGKSAGPINANYLHFRGVGSKSSYNTTTTDNKDGTYTVTLVPWQVGKNYAEISWGGKAVPGSPFRFDLAKAIDTAKMLLQGDGLKNGVAKKPGIINLVGADRGLLEKGGLTASMESDDGDKATVDLLEKGNGVYQITYVAPVAKDYNLMVCYDENSIAGCPRKIPVLPAPDAANCTISGAILGEEDYYVGEPAEYAVDCTEAGVGKLAVKANAPNGGAIRVFTDKEDGSGRDMYFLKFDPTIIGVYKVLITWENVPLPGSPYAINVVDPSKCIIKGLPLKNNGTAVLNEQIKFTVATKGAGRGKLSSTVLYADSDEEITLYKQEIKPDLFEFKFTPTVSGSFEMLVKFSKRSLKGSPFKCETLDTSAFGIVLSKQKGALVCEPYKFAIKGQLPEGQQISAVAHGPQADVRIDVGPPREDQRSASFIPLQPGSYEVFVECAQQQVPGSPFTVQAVDPGKCQILGNIPTILQVGQMEEFDIKTVGAGIGTVTVLANEEKISDMVGMVVTKEDMDTYNVQLEPRIIGEVSIQVLYSGFDIPQTPFRAQICDATKCRAIGETIDEQSGRVAEPVTFTVVTRGAGVAKLMVKPRGPSAHYAVEIDEVKEHTYQVSFTPWEVGQHFVEVMWGIAHIPKSPLSIKVGNRILANMCNATGDGLKKAISEQPAYFTIISSEVGLVDKGLLEIVVKSISNAAKVTVKDNNDGSYSVSYIAPTEGAYVVSITFRGNPIPGSPFKVNVVPGPDASKCRAYGPALKANAVNVSGSPLEFFVDAKEAGYGELTVTAKGPNDYQPKVFTSDNGHGIHTVKFDAKKHGRYFIFVQWSKTQIPNSPLKIKVHQRANAAMVRAHGPGLQNGRLGSNGEFTIETKDAGIGTLSIRVHGIKDAFRIDAKQESTENPRTLKAHYYPSLPGQYVIFIRWSGDHVPGSPFTVDILGGGYDGTPRVPLQMGMGSHLYPGYVQPPSKQKKVTATAVERSTEEATTAAPMTKKEKKAAEKEGKKIAKEEAKKEKQDKKKKKRISSTVVEEENVDGDEPPFARSPTDEEVAQQQAMMQQQMLQQQMAMGMYPPGGMQMMPMQASTLPMMHPMPMAAPMGQTKSHSMQRVQKTTTEEVVVHKKKKGHGKF